MMNRQLVATDVTAFACFVVTALGLMSTWLSGGCMEALVLLCLVLWM